MEEIQTIIQPINNGLGVAHYTGIVLFMLLCILMFALIRQLILKNDAKYRALFSMLCGMSLMILAATLILNQVNASKLSAIIFDEQTMSFRGKEINYDQIKQAFIEPTFQKSRYSSQLNKDTIYMGVLELKDQKPYIFSEENYDIEELISTIRAKM